MLGQKTTPPLFSILVNTSDGFEDCWAPFFFLLEKYWPNCDIPIYLNTERKEFNFGGLNIISTKVGISSEFRKSWSQCLYDALLLIETPFILYLQEDYFMESAVNVKAIEDFAEKMLNCNEIKYIGLTHFGNVPPFDKYSEDNRLKIVTKKNKYQISTQAALWDRQTLMSYLRMDENGWMFEIFGTIRRIKKNDLFLTVDRDLYNQNNRIFNYQHTGIVKGKWLNTMPELFYKENIKIDFSVRGLYKEKNPIVRKIETLFKIISKPSKIFRLLIE